MSENSQEPSSPSPSPATAFDLSKLRDELECCICLNLFKEPRNLPCGHICCGECVQGLIAAADQPVLFIKCPKCREEVPMPANGQLPTAFAIKSLVSHFKQAEAAHPKEVKMEAMGKCTGCNKFSLGQESFFCLNCHDNFIVASATRKEHEPDPDKMAKAEGLRLQGVQAYGRNALVEAIQLYTQSIRECPRPICLINRAQANIKLGRFPLAYLDANEALKLDPRNEKAKMLCDKALEWIKAEEAFNLPWPKNLRISHVYFAKEEENFVGLLVPQYVMCKEAGGESLKIPLNQLDRFLNEHVDGAVKRFSFKFVKIDEPTVQIFRRIKRERFEYVDENGMNKLCIRLHNCDFSCISESSLHFLMDELFCPNLFSISGWIGMPAGFNYNTLFKLKAFQGAEGILNYNVGNEIEHNFNLHLDSDVLIDFLHLPEHRGLGFIDGQLQDGFDSFLDRLFDRFTKDTQSRVYILVLQTMASWSVN